MEIMGGVIERRFGDDDRTVVGYSATLIFRDGTMSTTEHDTWDDAHLALGIGR